MLGKNLKYYRLKNNMTMKDLANKVGVTSMAISNYENNKRNPEMSILRKIAVVLEIKVMDLINIRNHELQFRHSSFRKNSSLSKTKQELLYEMIEEYFNRFFLVVDILGIDVLPPTINIHNIPLSNNFELCGKELRKWLNLSPNGPIANLINILENNGILVYLIDFKDSKFSGLNGLVNNYPYVAINQNMTPERQRFTIVHELVHIAFNWSQDEDDCENIANKVAGAFLFPEKDVYRELGVKRDDIKADMVIPAKEFGISMQCLAYRAKQLKIINNSAFKRFMIYISKLGWRKNEPSRIEQESSNLFKQLVYRAIVEDEINIVKGSELLKLSIDNIYDELNHFNDKE